MYNQSRREKVKRFAETNYRLYGGAKKKLLAGRGVLKSTRLIDPQAALCGKKIKFILLLRLYGDLLHY
jgi:hypothetical protein